MNDIVTHYCVVEHVQDFTMHVVQKTFHRKFLDILKRTLQNFSNKMKKYFIGTILDSGLLNKSL